METAKHNIQLDGGKPRYVLLAEALMGGIASGRYPVGGMLPTEMELCEQYGVSRHTAREALRRLREHGLVQRRQGVGTIVEARNPRKHFMQSLATIPDLLQYALDKPLSLIDMSDISASGAKCDLLHCKPGRRWLRIEGLRFSDSRKTPLCWTEILVDGVYENIREDVPGARSAVYVLIGRRYGVWVTEVEQKISGMAVPARLARLLKVKPHSPALCITRWLYRSRSELVQVATSIYPAGRFSYMIRLQQNPPA